MRTANTRPPEPVDGSAPASVVADVLDHHGGYIVHLMRQVQPGGDSVAAVPGEADIQHVGRPDQIAGRLEGRVDAVTGGIHQLRGPEVIEVARLFDGREYVLS